MILSVVSARVPAEREQQLREAFEANLADAAPLISRAFLAKNGDEDDLWQIVMLWQSREAIEDYRQVVGAPPDAKTFLSVGATPNPSVSEVISHWGGS